MVMHARKTQRISDGYFEKHQAHPYQNSKYGSSKGHYGDRYNHERLRESPNGNSYRSDSADSESPRERSYQNKIYVQKIREKERDRDYKSCRDKYSDCSRSPKDKRSRESRDSEHRTNHDRILEDKEKEKEKMWRVGDWSEHMSSSGKKYYYNCKTEVSQWEKPKEWIERTRYKDRDRDADRCYTAGSRLGHDKHSNTRASNSSVRESKLGVQQGRQPDREQVKEVERERDRLEGSQDRSKAEAASQDMDISPSESTPTSDASHAPAATATAETVLLANALPRLASHPVVDTAPPTAVTTSNVPGPPGGSVVLSAGATLSVLPVPPPQQQVLQPLQLQPLQVDTSCAAVVQSEGPPTPTHSETHDGTADPRKVSAVTSPPNSLSSLQSLTSLNQAAQAPGSSSLQALRQQGPNLTPSLANHYRDDLVNHVRGWPADMLEKQSQKLCEDAHTMTSLQCTRVSAELKTARSIVRLTEIQATLQEQRVLFLRQQIKTLEELSTQHSFMGDDS